MGEERVGGQEWVGRGGEEQKWVRRRWEGRRSGLGEEGKSSREWEAIALVVEESVGGVLDLSCCERTWRCSLLLRIPHQHGGGCFEEWRGCLVSGAGQDPCCAADLTDVHLQEVFCLTSRIRKMEVVLILRG